MDYNNILLKQYYEIAATNDFKKLLVSGIYNEHKATIAWEEIVRDNCKATNNRKYLQYIEAYREYLRLCNEESFVVTALNRLHFPPIDHLLIKELLTKGYRISVESSEKYAMSLKSAERQSRNLRTRINMQINLLSTIHRDEERSARNRGGGMQDSLARVSTGLNLPPFPQDILLSAFNIHLNILKERIAAQRKAA